MSKHTPMPWTTSNGSNRDEYWINIEAVTEGETSPAAFARVEGWNRRHKADARLIAAAPQLLEALKEMADDYQQLSDSGDAGNLKIEEEEFMIKARAAIRAAEGEG